MLSLKECFDFCGLTGDEVRAIAEHEHLSDIAAAVLGQSLLQTDEGTSEIKRFMRESRTRGFAGTLTRHKNSNRSWHTSRTLIVPSLT